MRTFAVGVALLAVGVLSGCGGTTDAGPPPAPATTPSASATPPPPAMPDAARQHTKAGAVAFVRHYVDLINHAQATGETQALKAVEDQRCRSCARLRKFIRELYAGGGHFEGGQASVVRVVDVVTPSQFGEYAVDVVISIKPSKVVKPASKPIRARGGKNTLGVYPKWTESGWEVAQWTRAK